MRRRRERRRREDTNRRLYYSSTTRKESDPGFFFRTLGEISKNAGEAVAFNTKVLLRELSNSKTKAVSVKPLRVKKFGLLKYGTEHLDGLNWEVMVVDSYQDNACYLPNGKIIFYTGWFKGYKNDFTDQDIATILAHEVGHRLARDPSESLIRALWVFALVALPLSKLASTTNHRASQITIGSIVAFFSRRMEREADYLGMMLMASAGYDPRHAPKFYKKHGNIETDFMTATHPSGQKRAKSLSRDQNLNKAMDIFNQVQSGQEVKNFI